MNERSRRADLDHIATALKQAAAVLLRHAAGELTFEMKAQGPVTAADHEVDALLRQSLPGPGDGWLSEETLDNAARLACRRVWIVDPLDGTRAFLARRPEYSVSIGLVEDGEPVLGGICNPATGVSVLGGTGLGVQVFGDPALPWPEATAGLRVLGSRSEWQRGEWRRWQRHGLQVLPMGSVAWKLALVAAGAADATWTLQPKNEWDVAAGAALVRAAGGAVWRPDGEVLKFNRRNPRLPCFAAATAAARERTEALLGTKA